MWWWEGIAFLERALLLYEPDADTWAALGGYHRLLGNEANALQATARGWELNPESLSVQEERAAILANVGELETAEKVIDKRRAAAPNVWADGVKAYILAEKRQYKEALRADWPGGRRLNLRIYGISTCAHGVSGCWAIRQRAEQDYRTVWSQYDEKAFDSQIIFGTAAYYLGDIEQAIKVFSDYPGACEDSNANWYLGACYLAQNKLLDGERHLAKSVALAKNSRR